MHAKRFFRVLRATVASVAVPAAMLAGCSDGPAPIQAPPVVYTQSNSASGNEIVAFTRAADGSLTELGRYATGGMGTDSGLGDQGSVVYDPSRNGLLAVNAGDSTLSMFAIEDDGSLTLLDQVDAGGTRPISIAVHGNLVYALNAGDGENGIDGNISGFRIDAGTLKAIGGSQQPLSAPNTGPAQIAFTPDGRELVVTEKGTSMLVTYGVGPEGAVSAPKAQASSGMTPFGFSFDSHGTLIVSEAFGGADNASALSSYTVSDDGTLNVVSASVPSDQSAACWVVTTGNFAYTTNTKTANVTGYWVADDGTLSLLESDGISGETGAKPIDAAVTVDGQYLYILNAGDDSLTIFQINADGSLSHLSDLSGIPEFAVGLVAL